MREDGGQDWDEDVVFRTVAAGQGVGGTEPVLAHTDDPWVSLMRVKSRNRSHSAGFPRKRAKS